MQTLESIPDYEGLYSITKDGRIWSYYNKGRWLTPNKQKSGHLRVCLCKNGIMKRYLVHRLVLLAFIGPCPEGMEACHFPDGNPSNNRLDNLRWDTHSANCTDAVQHGTAPGLHNKGEAHGSAKLNELKVRVIRRLVEIKYGTHREIAKLFDISRRTAGRVISRELWSHI